MQKTFRCFGDRYMLHVNLLRKNDVEVYSMWPISWRCNAPYRRSIDLYRGWSTSLKSSGINSLGNGRTVDELSVTEILHIWLITTYPKDDNLSKHTLETIIVLRQCVNWPLPVNMQVANESTPSHCLLYLDRPTNRISGTSANLCARASKRTEKSATNSAAAAVAADWMPSETLKDVILRFARQHEVN